MQNTQSGAERALAEIGGLAHDAALGRGSWEAPLVRLAGALEARSATLIAYSERSGACGLAAIHNLSDEALRAYADHYWALDSWRLGADAIDLPAGTPVTGEMVVPEEEFLSSEFFNDHLKLEGSRFFCGGTLLGGNREGAALGLVRDTNQGPFERHDLPIVREAMAHLARSVETHLRLLELESRWSTLTRALDGDSDGVLVIGADGRLIEANGAAQSLLRTGDALYTDGSGLRARDTIADGQLRASIRRSTDPLAATVLQTVFVPRGADRRPLCVRALPVPIAGPLNILSPAVAIVLISNPDLPPGSPVEEAAKRYRLTPAESRLLALLIEGLSPREASERLERSLHTVRNQLKHVYSKTDTSRQAQLVALVLRGPSGSNAQRNAYDPTGS